MAKITKWKIKDLIDLDYLLFLRRNKTSQFSDRDLYLNKIAPLADFKDLNSSQNNLVYLWLHAKKTEINKSSDLSMPGESFETILKFIILIFSIIAFFTGLFAAFAFLSYSGSTAINVFYYFGLFAGLQILILPFAIIPFLSGTDKNLLKKLSFFSPLSGLLKTVSEKIYKKFFQKSTKYTSDIFYFDLKKYSKPLFWLFFTISQSAAALFSTGVLLGTIIKVIGSDLAFGWQTTLNAGPEYILKIVNFISVPWAWIVPDSLTAPSLEQIAGSKIVLKEGMASLSTSDITSWWPFYAFVYFFML
jgi:phage-related holin